ncbi:SDR family oxidoreductase [Achromobacter ruhlandii]|uniref:Dihydroanticapsin 7-dehydrogenase n=1 Tax=Achromobacter ruhlandii TaxID=72557 RepID=A0ABM8M1J0_9BURK|nr:SDR family oxidoreductase [Achromobacter ruhlandii]AKP90561.1 Short-chain dehydrogenase/reductase SDR [Achromobacter xylosoxidans]AOU93800.1 short-chain dehydrogenase/reductase SDR [Achromobacter ruhlandii]MCZ8432930.1 SDR family NAD(P)-dependent oxidoreductase [Achromobacter ruhlandii]MDC6090752.1 SDR family NAD(P)-dependent oxidoreductase [Achromobacter ruhlandii]MDC6152084.1 SDR family NAD(P)-dependent oxidoreductase [Achromobacter ruhlandii]
MLECESLKGRVVLVTGGGSGLGQALCAMLAAQGARVALADIEERRAQQVVDRLRAEGADVMGCVMDVGVARDVQDGLDAVVRHFGRLDAVVNSAGIDMTAPIDTLDTDVWERVLRTNLTGPFLMAKLAKGRLSAGGHIVNVASTAARRAWPNASAYHASKWGLMGLSHALHAELRPAGLKVSAVIAGGMRTPFLLDRFPDIDVDTLQDPANVARAVCFVLTQPAETVVPEVMVLPMKETSWP